MMRHRQHELLAVEVRRWYEASYPEQGYVVEARPFGFYGRNDQAQHPATNRVTVRSLTPHEVPALLADVRRYYGSGRVFIFVDNVEADAALGPALLTVGCENLGTQIYLAHVGPIPTVADIHSLVIEPVIGDNLREFVVAKLKGFADGEAEPDPERIEADVSLRRAEMRGGAGFRLARLDGNAAGIIGWYEGPDKFIFILATRVPFRSQGVGRALLTDAIIDAHARGCRSVIINVEPAEGPIKLYRSLGFSDEVYWRHCYRLVIG